jgi:hypothetical protein
MLLSFVSMGLDQSVNGAISYDLFDAVRVANSIRHGARPAPPVRESSLANARDDEHCAMT